MPGTGTGLTKYLNVLNGGANKWKYIIQKVLGGSVEYNAITGYYETPSTILNKTEGLLGHNLKIVNNPVLDLGTDGKIRTVMDSISDDDVTIYVCCKPNSALTAGGQYDNMIVNNAQFSLTRDNTYNSWGTSNVFTYPVNAANNSFKLDVWNHVFVERLSTGSTFYIGYDGIVPTQSGTASQDAGTPTAGSYSVDIGSLVGTYNFDGQVQTFLVLSGAISEADRLAIFEGRFADITATIIDGYTISEANGSKCYSMVTGAAATISGTTAWVFDDKARPDFYMDGGDVWEDNSDPDNHESYIFVPYDINGNEILTDGDTLTGFTWLSTNPSGAWHNGGLNQYQNYEEAVLIAADIDYRLFYMDGTARKLSYYSRQYDYGCEHYAWSDDTEGQWKNFLLYSTPITEYKTQKAILSFLGRNIAECYYGYTYDQTVSDPALAEHGDITNPIIHDSIRHVVMNEDKSYNYILNPTDFQLQEDGVTASVLTGADGDAMLVYPYHYRYYSKSGNVETLIVSPYAIPGLEAVNKYGYGIYGGYLDGTKLRSISGVRRTTNKYITEFRTYAANKGSGWCQKSDEAWTAVAFLALIDIMSFNSQSEISAGATNASSTDWSNYNAYNPVVDTGLIDSLGSFTGGIPFSVANFVGGTLPLNSQAACWRGIEHIFGDIWEFVDGLNIHNSAANGARAYSCKNPAHFASDTDSNYELVGNIAEADGYVKKLLGGTILPKEVGGGSTIYMCDYHYSYYDNDPNSGWRVGLWGGALNYGAVAGLLCAHCAFSSSSRYANVGARLCCKLS